MAILVIANDPMLKAKLCHSLGFTTLTLDWLLIVFTCTRNEPRTASEQQKRKEGGEANQKERHDITAGHEHHGVSGE